MQGQTYTVEYGLISDSLRKMQWMPITDTVLTKCVQMCAKDVLDSLYNKRK